MNVETQPLDSIIGMAIFFGPCIAAFALATFSPLRQLRQPIKLFAIGLATGALAALLSIPAMSRATISGRAFLFIVGISIMVGALISVLASSGTISEKKRDEIVSKSDDQSWRI